MRLIYDTTMNKINGDDVKIVIRRSAVSGACFTHLSLLDHNISGLFRISSEGLTLLRVSIITIKLDFEIGCKNYRVIKIIGMDEV